MLQALKKKKLQPGLSPDSLMTDFGKGVIRAFQEAFPGLNCTGCFFHLSQSVWRRIQAAGLQLDYQTDPDFASWLGCLPVLVYSQQTDLIPEHWKLRTSSRTHTLDVQTAVETVSPHCSH